MTPKRRPPKKVKDTIATQRAGHVSVQHSAAGEAPQRVAVPRGVSERKAPERRSKKARETPAKKHRWPRVAALAIVLVVLVVAAAFSWDRWLRYDDAQDMTGEWDVPGTGTVIVLDGQAIKLTDEVSWPYTLDTGAKTISFTFGNRSGEGRYRFSPDRTQLTIMEGEGYSWTSTLFEDIAWSFDNVVRAVQGQPSATVPSDDSVTTLSLVSHDGSASPHDDASLASAGEASSDGGRTSSENAASQDGDSQGGVEGAEDAASDTSGTPETLFDVSDV